MKSKNLIVGLFVIAGLVLFTIGLFLIGDRHEAFSHHIDYYAEFTNLSGLTKGSKVQVAGMDAGQVVEIVVPSSPAARFRVKIQINDRLRGLVRTDSLATIGTEGVVGETFLLIHPGGSHTPAANSLATLPTKEPLDLASLLDQGQGLVGDADDAIRDADKILKTTSGQLGSTLSVANTTLGNVNDVIVGLKQGRGPAGMLLQDQAMAGQIRETVTSAQQASANLASVSGQANGLINDIRSRQFPEKIDETMGVVKSAASNLDASALQIRQTIAEASLPDRDGATAGTNIAESLSNVNYATANMADETEALKHNFLLRGFFRRRGYFNLEHISAETYRKDTLFTASTNPRVWLPGDQMFSIDASGTERLTAQGKAQLDQVVTSHGDAFLDRPIMIEGYAAATGSSDQSTKSRLRALVVRRYLDDHFQLDASHLGIVAMKDTPPAGLEHTSWDGICLVILPLKK
jgi:phospholipid/cholesterol/gamma-HCH transport system substrate-binding protein